MQLLLENEKDSVKSTAVIIYYQKSFFIAPENKLTITEFSLNNN